MGATKICWDGSGGLAEEGVAHSEYHQPVLDHGVYGVRTEPDHTNSQSVEGLLHAGQDLAV